MAIFEVQSDTLKPLKATTLAREGVRERDDLQRLLRDQIEVLGSGLLVIAEEFGRWEGSKRRIDLLAVDRSANLVVVELKRTESGGHMELQALRYAAMVSTMTFDLAVQAYTDYLAGRDLEVDAAESLLEFLGWSEPDEEGFAQDVRIILASSDFSKELTTAVLWLNARDLDVRCVRLRPYTDGSRVLLDVQQVIPLPEAEEFQIQVREKARRERKARSDNRDMTRFDVVVDGQSFTNLPKRRAIFRVARSIVSRGTSPEEMTEKIPRSFTRVWRVADGHLNEDEFIEAVSKQRTEQGKGFDSGRWFTVDGEMIQHDGRTYAFHKMWGGSQWLESMQALVDSFPEIGVEFYPTTHT